MDHETKLTGPCRATGKTIVYHAEGKFAGVYDFKAEAEGIPGFYTGRVTMYFGGATFKAEGSARGGERAIALALRKVCDGVLEHFPMG